jgi:ankyrin repeat protein
MLIAAGASINIEDDSGERPLHKLLNSRGDNMPMDLLKRFLHHRADISANDKYGQQALFEVAEGGNAEALKLILDHDPKAEVDHQDDQGLTALHNAAQCGNYESCKLLVGAGADASKMDNQFRTPFYLSCFADNIESTDFLAQLLREKDSKLLAQRNTDGKTALRKSAALGKTEIVKLLLAKYQEYIDINVADNILNWSPLHIAAYQGSTDVVELLLSHGADSKCQDKRGRTALMLSYQQWELLQSSDIARDTSFESCLVALIEADRHAAISETNLLSAAARKGSIPVLEVLVLGQPGQPKADPVLRDEYGWTAIELAKQYKRQLAVDFLQQHSGLTGRFPEAWVITKPDRTRWDPKLRELYYTKDLEEGGDSWDQRVTVFADVSEQFLLRILTVTFP